MYQSLMSNDMYYRVWREQNPGANAQQLEKRFIDRNWPKCIEFARATLVEMLKRPDISEEMKEDIMDILEKDQSLQGKIVVG